MYIQACEKKIGAGQNVGPVTPDFELPYTSYSPDGQNGRINFAAPRAGGAGSGSPDVGTLTVPGFEYGTQAEPNFVEDMLRGI